MPRWRRAHSRRLPAPIGVYAYKDGSYKAVGSTPYMRKVVTGAELTQIISSKGDTLTLENAPFSYIPKPIATETARAAKPQGCATSYDNGTIKVVAKTESVPRKKASHLIQNRWLAF